MSKLLYEDIFVDISCRLAFKMQGLREDVLVLDASEGEKDAYEYDCVDLAADDG